MTIKNDVERLLMEDVRTRECDNWLVVSYLKEIGIKIDLNYLQCLGIPNFEILTRARRKLQEENPELKGTDKIQERRERSKNQHTKKYGRDYSSIGMMKNSNLR